MLKPDEAKINLCKINSTGTIWSPGNTVAKLKILVNYQASEVRFLRMLVYNQHKGIILTHEISE